MTLLTCFLLSSCGSVRTSAKNDNDNPYASPKAEVVITPESNPPSSNVADNLDYSQYLKRVWIAKDYDLSFCITKIKNRQIEGRFATDNIGPGWYFTYFEYFPDFLNSTGNLTGIVSNGKAVCQFNDKRGNTGNIDLNFKSVKEIEATVTYTVRDPACEDLPADGTFQFRPYNMKDIDGFSPFKDQCFSIELNSWGTVNFISGKVTHAHHINTVAYLANEDGDIFYKFDSVLGNNLDYDAVSFQDINKDGLKDLVLIVSARDYGFMGAVVLFIQKADGAFEVDSSLSEEVNQYLGDSKSLARVMDYLSVRQMSDSMTIKPS